VISKYTKGKVCVFIDAANLESAVKKLGWWIGYEKFYNYFKKETDLVQIRYYCVRHNTESQDRFFTFIKRRGFKLITKPIKEIKRKEGEIYKYIRKANFDVEISLDAYILKDSYQTLILFSGDSDFKYLIETLKKEGKRIIVVSSKHYISKELIEVADKFISLKKLKNFIKRDDR
jgi:uncharacterized LabA/DUF88 family protein